MTTTPVTSNTNTMSALTGVKTAKAGEPGNELGRDAFLKLLVAQLKYQDPLNPADGAEFLAQTAQFTMVEKLTEMVTQGEKTALSQQETQAAQLVGKQVTYLTTSGTTEQGLVESTKFTDDSQTLTIGGKAVQLTAVTGVIGAPDNAQLTAALANLGPSLSANLAPELAAVLRQLGVNSFASSSSGTTTVPAEVTDPIEVTDPTEVTDSTEVTVPIGDDTLPN